MPSLLVTVLVLSNDLASAYGRLLHQDALHAASLWAMENCSLNWMVVLSSLPIVSVIVMLFSSCRADQLEDQLGHLSNAQ